MKTLKCPQCGNEHGLFWLVRDKDKKDLMYRCNKVEKRRIVRGTNPPREEMKYFTESILAPAGTIADADLPTEWTPAYAKKVQGEKQTQLILMNT